MQEIKRYNTINLFDNTAALQDTIVMENTTAANIFEALSSPIRLNIFRLLVKHAAMGLVAGDMAAQLNTSAANLSFHLKTLLQVQLVSVEQEGRFMRYRANIPLMLTVITFLTSECCQDAPEKCLEFRKANNIPKGLLPDPI